MTSHTKLGLPVRLRSSQNSETALLINRNILARKLASVLAVLVGVVHFLIAASANVAGWQLVISIYEKQTSSSSSSKKKEVTL